jgi:hypothetical protein
VRPVVERSERVAGSAVDVAGLQADDRRGIQLRQPAGDDALLIIGAQPHGPAAPEPDQAQRLEHRSVDLITDHHLDRGRADQPGGAASQPARVSTASRPAARHVALAIVAPATKPPMPRRAGRAVGRPS